MIKRIIQTAGFAGVGAALVLTLFQATWVSPLILQAEIYEHAASTSHHALHESDDHSHENDDWSPEDGWQRTSSTAAANLVIGVGFGLVLVGVMSLRPTRKLSSGVLWGLAGYTVFVLAPSAGLPPELPGTESAALHDRQLWWAGTALATAIGLALIAFGPKPWLKVVAVVLLAVPHLLGSPQLADAHMLAPASLHHEFVTATLLADASFWITLGLLSALFFQRTAAVGRPTSSNQEYA